MLDIPLHDRFRETRIFGARIMVSAVFIGLVILVLLGRLIYLQAINHQHFVSRSQANKITPLPIAPVRGLILDRKGVVLAQNYPVFTLEITPEQVDDLDKLLARLGRLVQLSDTDLRQFHKQRKKRPRFESQVLRSQLTEEEASRIAVNLPTLRGVDLKAGLQRHYPYGPLGVHLLGYVSRISEADLDSIDRSSYRGTHHIGKLGIERTYEATLLGRVGIRKVETNARGRAVHENEAERIPPRAGGNLILSIDAGLQAEAEKALAGKRAALVAIDPNNGAILAIASTPTYDPNLFVNGIDHDSYNALLTDINKPLINRAINGQYAPGSTIKPFYALAGLETEKIAPAQNVICKGAYSLPGDSHRYRDWKKSGHGIVNLTASLAESCDVYYYKLATSLGIDTMTEFLDSFGFGKATGVDLVGESDGLIPDRKWRDQRKDRWYKGETVVTGIGQGPLLATPLQLAKAVASLARRGLALRPQILMAVENPVTGERLPRPLQKVRSPSVSQPENYDHVIQAMIEVVHGKEGTARGIGWNAPYRIAGKTGTAQVKSIAQTESYDAKTVEEFHRDHALFVAFAPADDPRIAIAVIVENGGHGSRAAAPVARKIMDYYLLPDKKPVLPDTVKQHGASQ
jgi:penicillin-binding protein 2